MTYITWYVKSFNAVIDAASYNSIRTIQEKIQSEFRKDGKTALPLAKGVEDDRHRATSE